VERSDTQDSSNSWDWFDGLESIWRARYVIVGATLLAGLLTAAVMLVTPRSYQAVAALRVGKVMDRVLVDPLHVAFAINSDSIGGRLRQAGVTDRSAEQLADAVSAIVDSQVIGNATVTSLVVSVEARGRTVEEAKRLALAASQVIIDEHRPRYDASMKRVGEFREQLESQVAAIRGEITEVEAAVRSFRSNPSVAAPAILLMRAQLEEKQTQLLGFLREQRDLDLNLTVNSEMTRVLAEPAVPRSRIRPRRTITTLGGAAMGGLLAVFWAVAWDARRRRQNAATAATAR
jgi:uncharacterized protein involved in exopolysaccharide biosynthesis